MTSKSLIITLIVSLGLSLGGGGYVGYELHQTNKELVDSKNAIKEIRKLYVDIPQQATVKVVSLAGQGHGSGSILTNSGIISTAKHVADLEKNGKLKIKLPNGQEYIASVIQKSATDDIALLKIDNLANTILPVLPFVFDLPKQGDRLTLWGYAGSNPLLPKQLVYEKSYGSSRGETMLFNDVARPGDSGGPIVNSQNEVVGVVVAMIVGGKGGSLGVSMSKIQNFTCVNTGELCPA
jgi:S1-C subfamily serine protease